MTRMVRHGTVALIAICLHRTDPEQVRFLPDQICSVNTGSAVRSDKGRDDARSEIPDHRMQAVEPHGSDGGNGAVGLFF